MSTRSSKPGKCPKAVRKHNPTYRFPDIRRDTLLRHIPNTKVQEVGICNLLQVGGQVTTPAERRGDGIPQRNHKGGSGSYAFLIRRSLAQRSFWAAAIFALPSAVI